MPADGPHALRHTTTTASPDWTANRRERCIVALMAPVLASRSGRMPAPGPLISRAVTFRLRPAAAPQPATARRPRRPRRRLRSPRPLSGTARTRSAQGRRDLMVGGQYADPLPCVAPNRMEEQTSRPTDLASLFGPAGAGVAKSDEAALLLDLKDVY